MLVVSIAKRHIAGSLKGDSAIAVFEKEITNIKDGIKSIPLENSAVKKKRINQNHNATQVQGMPLGKKMCNAVIRKLRKDLNLLLMC